MLNVELFVIEGILAVLRFWKPFNVGVKRLQI